MYEIPFSKMLQPRLGATWAYNGKDTVYASYATYNPAASSLPRAASWDRNVAVTHQRLLRPERRPVRHRPARPRRPASCSSTDLTPRTIDETLRRHLASSSTAHWSARLYGRYRSGKHFWEDTNNDARLLFNPPAGIPRELYIPNLTAQRTQIGSTLNPPGLSGSTYVIAELDGAFTKYYEGTLETEWKNDKTFVRGSYTWSHYYGNFDQDNSGVDQRRQHLHRLVEHRRRRRPAALEQPLRRPARRPPAPAEDLRLPRAAAGTRPPALFGVAQSGQPWEAWSYEPYLALTTTTSDTTRYAEPAGSRRTASHWQVDLNYTQNVRLGGRYNFQIVGDLFNLANQQTGYNFQPAVHNSAFNTPRNYFDPRRFQLAFRFQF